MVWVMAFTVISLICLWPTWLWRPRPLHHIRPRRPLRLGHRGVRGHEVENSLAAMQLAFREGLDGIECDVQHSKDRILVLYHDFHLPSGVAVQQLTLEELRAEVPSVCTVDALLLLAHKYPNTLINLETKVAWGTAGGLERHLVRTVVRAGLEQRVLISSFNPLSLLWVRLHAPEVRIALLFDKSLPRLLRTGALAAWLHADAIHPHHSSVTPLLMQRAKVRGLMVNTWTVNDPTVMQQMRTLGVDGIMADEPRTLHDALN